MAELEAEDDLFGAFRQICDALRDLSEEQRMRVLAATITLWEPHDPIERVKNAANLLHAINTNIASLRFSIEKGSAE